MKKLLIVIALALRCLSPTPALAVGFDDGSPDYNGADAADDAPACTEDTCACSYSGAAIARPTGSAPITSSASCQAACEDAVGLQLGGTEDPALVTHSYADCPGAPETPAVVDEDPIFPILNVPIPGIIQEKCGDRICWKGVANVTVGGEYESNLLGTYINALYNYLLLAAALIAVTMIMIGGLQYATARGDAKQLGNAKKRISGAVAGMILLLLSYNIAYIINPETTTFKSLSIKNVDTIAMNKALTGLEGSGARGGPGPWTNLNSPYLEITTAAKNGRTCDIPEGLASPVGNQNPGVLPNQGNHHWFDKEANGDFTKIYMLDWAAGWGNEVLAPFSGTVSYEKSTSVNKCGNKIILKGSGKSITICHAKDFLNDKGVNAPGMVTQGQVIGHLGGVCCSGGTAPEGYVTKCETPGTACTDPFSSASCACQPLSQAGNTTGPHVHITMDNTILTCLK